MNSFHFHILRKECRNIKFTLHWDISYITYLPILVLIIFLILECSLMEIIYNNIYFNHPLLEELTLPTSSFNIHAVGPLNTNISKNQYI